MWGWFFLTRVLISCPLTKAKSLFKNCKPETIMLFSLLLRVPSFSSCAETKRSYRLNPDRPFYYPFFSGSEFISPPIPFSFIIFYYRVSFLTDFSWDSSEFTILCPLTSWIFSWPERGREQQAIIIFFPSRKSSNNSFGWNLTQKSQMPKLSEESFFKTPKIYIYIKTCSQSLLIS